MQEKCKAINQYKASNKAKQLNKTQSKITN